MRAIPARRRASLENWAAMGIAMPRCNTLMRDGYDELGARLVFDGGAYWYGSTPTRARAAELAPYNNATSLQVASGVICVLQWMLDHPREGVVEAEDPTHNAVLSVAMPYLGLVHGVETDWKPCGKVRLQFADFLETRDLL
jgi:homospermidine synthase